VIDLWPPPDSRSWSFRALASGPLASINWFKISCSRANGPIRTIDGCGQTRPAGHQNGCCFGGRWKWRNCDWGRSYGRNEMLKLTRVCTCRYACVYLPCSRSRRDQWRDPNAGLIREQHASRLVGQLCFAPRRSCNGAVRTADSYPQRDRARSADWTDKKNTKTDWFRLWNCSFASKIVSSV